MIDSLLSTSDQLLAHSLELLDSSRPPSKISTTDSSMRLIKKPVKLEIHKIHHLDFLMISNSHNSLDEDEAHRKADSPCLCHHSCKHFKCCAKIKNGLSISGQNQIKEKSMNAMEDNADYEEEQYNCSITKEERQDDNLYNTGERETIKEIENTQFLCDLMEETNSEFREAHDQIQGKLNAQQDDETQHDFISKMKQDHINEKLLTFKQKKMACILSKNSRSKKFLEVDFSDEDSEREEMSSHSNSLASFTKCRNAKTKICFLEDFEEEEEGEEDERKEKIKEQGYLNLEKDVGKEFDDVLKEKESVNEFDLLQKYEFNDEIVGDGFEEEEEKVEEIRRETETLIIRRFEVN